MAKVEGTATQEFVGRCLAFASSVSKLPSEHVWLDYDREADVLYISFRRPQRATKTVEIDDDILLRKDGAEIVGLTILNASLKGGKG
ncbi:MAG: DUF2283 domain-containing protein [Planctomycetes bacterium]|nr:DUF2283 domain-containing protein [Planctomycetota bacterium]